MKSIYLFIAIIIIAGCVNAQKLKESDVPQAVLSKFKSLYSTVNNAEWGKENADYEAGFKINGEETSVVIDASGNMKETEVEIPVSQLSEAITDYCATNFKGYKISEASKIIDSENITTYEAELKNGKDKFDALFDTQGKFVKKVVEQTGKEEKD